MKQSFSTLEEKILWLLQHHIFLVGKADKSKIVRAMKHDGLISPRTYWPDVNVDDAIHQAKIRWFALHNQDRQARE